MKKNKNIFMASVLLLSLGLASCTDSFLDVTSKTESSTGTFYKTEKDAYRALIGCYDGWRQTSSAMMVGFYMASEVMSAECFGATGMPMDVAIRPLTVLTSPNRRLTSTYTKVTGKIIMRASIVATS